MTAIPSWLKSYLSEQDLAKIELAVQRAEHNTTGEVVPMIVHRSTTSGHVPLILFLIFTAFFFAYDFYRMQMDTFVWPLWLIFALNLVVGLILAKVLAKIPFIERFLANKVDQNYQVNQRAMLEFYNHRVNHTENATGILIFISLLEHRAVVLGDQPIASRLPQDAWQEVVDLLIAGIKGKKLAEGYIQAIEKSGQILATHFPHQRHNPNELPNKLIIKE